MHREASQRFLYSTQRVDTEVYRWYRQRCTDASLSEEGFARPSSVRLLQYDCRCSGL